MSQNYLSAIVQSLNNFILSIQDDELPSSCPTGTVSNINVKCKDYNYSGTYGNKTTNGYYATYSFSVDNVINIFDIKLIPSYTYEITPNTDTGTSEIVGYFKIKYLNNLQITGNASGNGSVYTPQYKIPGTCIPYIYCIPSITIPSTYPGVNYSISDTYTFTISGLQIDCSIGLTFSFLNPGNFNGSAIYFTNSLTDSNYVEPIIIYLYSFSIGITNYSYSSYSIQAGQYVNIDNQEVNNILETIGYDFQPYVFNTYVKNLSLQIILNAPTTAQNVSYSVSSENSYITYTYSFVNNYNVLTFTNINPYFDTSSTETNQNGECMVNFASSTISTVFVQMIIVGGGGSGAFSNWSTNNNGVTSGYAAGGGGGGQITYTSFNVPTNLNCGIKVGTGGNTYESSSTSLNGNSSYLQINSSLTLEAKGGYGSSTSSNLGGSGGLYDGDGGNGAEIGGSNGSNGKQSNFKNFETPIGTYNLGGGGGGGNLSGYPGGGGNGSGGDVGGGSPGLTYGAGGGGGGVIPDYQGTSGAETGTPGYAGLVVLFWL